MSELHLPSVELVHFELQPDFPKEDLSKNNAQMFAYQFKSEAGLDAYAEQLQYHQRYIHAIADRALKVLGIKTRYAEEELLSFSHGFASFEAISDVVHPPRAYNISLARECVQQLFVDTRDFLDIEYEELIRAAQEDRDPLPVARDYATPEFELSNRHNILPEQFPNTYDVIIGIGESRNESMAQLQSRATGALLAYLLQSE